MSKCAEKSVWYAHSPDQGCAREHFHGLMFNVISKAKDPRETWKNWIKEELGVKEFDRNDWYFTSAYKDDNNNTIKITEESIPRFITYMSKGEVIPINYGYDDKYLEERRLQWVSYKKQGLSDEDIYASIKTATVKERYTVFQFQHDAIVEVQNICKSVQELDFNTKCELVTRVKQLAFDKKFRVHEKFIYEVCQAITAFYFPDYFASRVASRF